MHLPLQEYHGTNIVQIRPQENITGSAFSGQCTFIMDVGKDEMVLPQSIYLSGRFSVSSSETNTGTNAVTGHRPLGYVSTTNGNIKPVGCIASGGIDNLFTKAQHEISGLNGSSVVQNIENYPQTCSLLRLNHEHPQIAPKNTVSPFMLRSKREVSSITSFFGDSVHTSINGGYLSNISETDVEYLIKNAYKQGASINTEFSLSTKLPLAYFMQENKIYQSQHIIRFTIDSAYQSKFVNVVNIAGSNTASLGAVTPFDGTYVQSAAATNQVAVKVNDLFLYVEYVKINLPMGRPLGTFRHVFESWNTTLHACPNALQDNFILPCKPNLLKIIMGFRRNQKLLSNGTYAAPLINPEQIGFQPINLTQLYVKYLSDTYPQTQYTMSLLNSLATAVDDGINSSAIQRSFDESYDNARAYEDYLINSEFETPEEAMTYEEWLDNPIFVFKFCNTTNQSSSIEVNLQCAATTPKIFNLANGTSGNAGVGCASELNGAILYVMYVYRTMVESNFTEDSVTYTVSNLV